MKKIFIYLASSLLFLSGCTKLIDVGTSPNELATSVVFSDSASAVSALMTAYGYFNTRIDPQFNSNISTYTDDAVFNGLTQPYLEFYKSKVQVSNSTCNNIWTLHYTVIYSCNDIITQVQRSNLSPAYKADLTAEAKFLRAYAYYYLVNLYGHIPLLLTTEVNANAQAGNKDSASVFQQIVNDLKDAASALPVEYRGDGRVRANKYAAAAMLAKVYLEQRDWVNAEMEASLVLNSTLYTPLQPLSTVFVANSQETILSFWTKTGYIANGPSLVPSGGAPQYPISAALLDAFEAGDLRKTIWLSTAVINGTTYYFPYKYHNRSANTSAPENLMALRAADQYLIRAEAKAQQGNIAGAADDLNIVRARAGLGNTTAATQDDMLTAIFHERQTEMFMENGNRFIDLKRTGTINAVMSAYKNTWTVTADLLPIPQSEITHDANLVQNAGY
jgi:hypothetical protein